VNNLYITVPAAVLPSLLLLWYFYSKDKYPEPPRVIFTTFFLGILTIIPVLCVALPMLYYVANRLEDPYAYGIAMGCLSAGIPEEFFKFTVILFYCMRHSEFDEPMDGLVYGVTASLGFATLENVLYVSQGGLHMAIGRALTAVPMHAAVGAIMGYYCGRARFAPAHRGQLLFTAWFVPMLLHSLYDIPLFVMMKRFGGGISQTAEGTPDFSNADAMFVLGCLGTVLLVLIISLVMAVRLARKLKNEQASYLGSTSTGESAF
jgi:RsiW-degrading membrane proteinase PrsW (M82 family)